MFKNRALTSCLVFWQTASMEAEIDCTSQSNLVRAAFNMASAACRSLVLIAFAACTAAADGKITGLSDAEIGARLVGEWYNACDIFEFRSNGSCGYYVVSAERGSPQVLHRRLSTYGKWHVHYKKLACQWHRVKPSDPLAPLMDGTIRFVDSERLEINEPWPGFRRFTRTRLDPCILPP